MSQDDDSAGIIIGIIVVIIFGWLFFSSLGDSSSPNDTNSASASDYESDTYDSSSSDYESSGDNEDFYNSQGYECADDCSGHDAGYEWADENGVCDDSFGDGNSASFDEGVIAYTEENC